MTGSIIFAIIKHSDMLRGILPKEYKFYDYFEKLMDINLKISEEFMAIAEGKVSLENASRTIKYHERETDKLSHDCIDLLHKTFIVQHLQRFL